MMAPTKNPSSRLKITPQVEQVCFRLKGRATIEARPQTGHCSFRQRQKVSRIVRGSRLCFVIRTGIDRIIEFSSKAPKVRHHLEFQFPSEAFHFQSEAFSVRKNPGWVCLKTLSFIRTQGTFCGKAALI